MRRLLPILALAVLALPLSAPSRASPPCGAYEAYVEYFKRQYQETRLGVGILGPSALMELLVSPEGSWTILFTTPGGRTCVMGSGNGWVMAPYIPYVPDEPA